MDSGLLLGGGLLLAAAALASRPRPPPVDPRAWPSRFFSYGDLVDRDDPLPRSLYPELQELVRRLDLIQARSGGRIRKVISGYRSRAHNQAINGAQNSQHINARAADFTANGVTPRQLFAFIRELVARGELPPGGGIGLYPTFVHYDTRPARGNTSAPVEWGEGRGAADPAALFAAFD